MLKILKVSNKPLRPTSEDAEMLSSDSGKSVLLKASITDCNGCERNYSVGDDDIISYETEEKPEPSLLELKNSINEISKKFTTAQDVNIQSLALKPLPITSTRSDKQETRLKKKKSEKLLNFLKMKT
ncbi:uncharacterized protein LOC135119679 [Zophobas morio]|uniref:uncharacterized protein LOC135119679 n=1 Tax=Zophobas morio TaxID=2755281 RepID=UPI003082E76C